MHFPDLKKLTTLNLKNDKENLVILLIRCKLKTRFTTSYYFLNKNRNKNSETFLTPTKSLFLLLPMVTPGII